MFSPEATIGSLRGSQRNPRRRQRVKDDADLHQQPRAKRQKSIPHDAHLNGNGSARMNGHVGQTDVEKSLVLVDMPVREKKAPTKRALRDDSALYLTKNENYSVKKLPSFPASLLHASAPFRASALPSAGLALALTSTQALAWDYTSSSGPARVLTLALPFNLRPSDPLPLGAIVRNGPTNDFGILALAPSSGKITFWENVDSAEARNQFAQRHQAIDGSVKVYSGETITDLVDVDHAGYVIIFSSGRLVQLTLRDAQGRPSIATNAMQAPSSSSSSFFSFKGLLGNAFRKSIASVKARPSESKGQMEVIAASKNCLFQAWDLSYSGQQIFKYEVDVQAEILATLQMGIAPEVRSQQEAHILDFVVLEHPRIQGTAGLLVLVALSGRGAIDYSLLEIDLSHTTGSISRAVPLRNFHQSELPGEASGTLLLPQPGHTAFVEFPGAIVVASLAQPEESPDAQLLGDSGAPSLPFQDTIYLVKNRQNDICGRASGALLKKDNQSSTVFFIKGYGIVQVKAKPPSQDEDDNERHKVTAKSKIEQTTFFSTVPGTILDFSIKRSGYMFAPDEVEKAAIDISGGLLSSSYEHLEKVTSSLADQISKRASALHVLISTLRDEYQQLSFQTTWHLLWDAEKVSAASALWNLYQETVEDQQAHPEAYPEALYLPYMIRCLHERYKTKIQADLGETDPVRQFFLKDVSHMDSLLLWSWKALRVLKDVGAKEKTAKHRRVIQGCDIVLRVLETAFEFRKQNKEKYGLDPANFDGALLLPNHGQDLLPGFWTSTHNIVVAARGLTDAGRLTIDDLEDNINSEAVGIKLAADNPRLVQLACMTHIERFRWLLAQVNEKQQEAGRSLEEEFDKRVRPECIYHLLDIGQGYEAMALAEQYKDMETLSRIVWDELHWLREEKAGSLSKMEQAECNVKLGKMKQRIQGYFDQYGDAWASAFYSRYIQKNQSGHIFDEEYLNQPALTKFLRSSSSHGRLAWINEVLGEKNYSQAADELREVATTRETNVWCKKVELSIAKLSLLASKEKTTGADTETPAVIDPTAALANTTDQLNIIKVQQRLAKRFEPDIEESLDDNAAVELLMQKYGQELADRPAHQQLLQQAFDELIHNKALDPALLIDLLTLMTPHEGTEVPRRQPDITDGNEFAFALRVLALAWEDLSSPPRTTLLRLIWKRLLIRDDWAAINNTKDVSDSQLDDFLVETGVGSTYKMLLSMIEQYPSHEHAKPPSISKILKAGCVNSELATRFPSEDLRRPIVADNLADEEKLENYVNNHRLDEWFTAALQAAQKSYDRSRSGPAVATNGHLSDGSVSEEEEDEPDTNGTNGQAAAGGDGDVTMQDQ